MKAAFLFVLLFLACAADHVVTHEQTVPAVMEEQSDSAILSYIVDPFEDEIRLFWKNDSGMVIGNFRTLREQLTSEGRELIFAMNGGMFMEDFTPLGLYVEEGLELKRMNKVAKAHGNFYLQPNGVFHISERGAGVCTKEEYERLKGVQFATQSGPMLLIDGAYHPAIRKGSKNLHIRNAVGILPDGKVLFALSKERINFYDLATFFKEQGCRNALYLDGFVSRAYLPEKDWTHQNGRFGPMIAVVK